MTYQDDILAYGREIFACPYYRESGAFRTELADVSKGIYKHGPEISFVGEGYGQAGSPRILFTRLNPTWNEEIGWFGTLESVTEYQMIHPGASTKDVFQCYLKGWNHGSKVYRGMWDAGTVTGHPNQSTLPSEEKRRSPSYGIQVIMEEMVRAGIFPETEESPLEFCAINNAVKCAGSLQKWNPSSSMIKNCNYYAKELDILEPHILVAFGNKTDIYIRSRLRARFMTSRNPSLLKLSNAENCLYYKFPHPLGPGKNTWIGNDAKGLVCLPEISRAMGSEERTKFKAGPAGVSTERLFNYILHLVSEAKKLKDRLGSF